MDHVNTQLPYALTAALIAGVFYVVAGVMTA
jgi:Na+/H+ antiporter NhaC